MQKLLRVLLVVCLIVSNISGVVIAAKDDDIHVYEQYKSKAATHVPDEILVKFKNDNKPFHVVKIGKGRVDEKIKEYQKNPNVEFVEANYYAQAYVNDPYYIYQWNLKDESEGGINAEMAWSVSTGDNVVVAVLDTGIAYSKFKKYSLAPDLSGTSFVSGYDFINNDNKPNDDEGHGTHVAGTIAQTTNNALGVAGVAYNASLMPVKVLNGQGSGSYSTIASGIYYAADNNADVINMSLGGPSESQVLLEALEYAYNEGVTIVAATGNDAGVVGYPAAYDDFVIAVGATRYDKELAGYSNFGPEVDIVAPGGDTDVDQNNDGYGDGILQNTFGNHPGDFGYYFYQGTSMATPHVAGTAALLISNDPSLSPAQVQSALQDTAIDLGATGRDDFYGHGLVDAYAALNWTAEPTEPNEPPIADDKVAVTDEDVSVMILLSGSDLDGDILEFSIVDEPSFGTLSGVVPELIYTPDNDYNGVDNFSYIAYDGVDESLLAMVSLTINPVNDNPVATDESVMTEINTPVVIILSATDIDGDALVYTGDLISISGGSISWDGTDTVVYTPSLDFVGNDTFEFSVNDGFVDSNTALVDITVVEEAEIGVVTFDKVTTLDSGKSGKQQYLVGTSIVTVYEDGSTVADALVVGRWEGVVNSTRSVITRRDGTATFKLERTKFDLDVILDEEFIVESITIDGVIYPFN